MQISIDKFKSVVEHTYISESEAIQMFGGKFAHFAYFFFMIAVAALVVLSISYFFTLASLVKSKYDDARYMSEILNIMLKFKTISNAMREIGGSDNKEILDDLDYYLQLDYAKLTYEETEAVYSKIK